MDEILGIAMRRPLSIQLAEDVPFPSVKQRANCDEVDMKDTLNVTTELTPRAAPECKLSADAAASVPSTQGL
jgi:hypothetical protein